MDFDLFELDDDDDIFGTICIEPTQEESEPITDNSDSFPELNCGGEDSLHSQFSPDGFLKKKFVTDIGNGLSRKASDRINLTSYSLNYDHLSGSTVQFLFGEAFMSIQHLITSVRGDTLGHMRESCQTTHYGRRQLVTQLLHLILRSHSAQWPLFKQQVSELRNLSNSISTKDTWKLIYFANSCKGNECTTPAYHLFHGLLEWKILDLCIFYKYEIDCSISPETNTQKSHLNRFLMQISRTFDDLLLCSLHLYTKKRCAELLHSSPFPCTCIKEFWLLLQFALNEWKAKTSLAQYEEFQQLDFWSLFDKAMSRFKSQSENFSLSLLHYNEFSIWLLQSLTRLHGYRSNGQYEGPSYKRATVENAENFVFAEQCVQQFLNSNPNEERLRVFICLLTPIVLEWWRPSASIPMLLWEYFHKRLNSSFYATGTAPCNLAVACGSGRAYLERYRTLLTKSTSGTLDANLSSYSLFILLLGKCLERLRKAVTCGNQAQKLLGRIYSKFSSQKLLTLNESGIHHLIELFIILALCGDFQELTPKLREQLLSIAFEKVTTQRQVAVAKGHIAMLILHAEHHCDIGDYVTKLLQQLAIIQNSLPVTKIIADGLLDIFQHSEGNFVCGEHLLISAWLPALLENCTPVEQERTLEALHLIFIKLESSANIDYVVPYTQSNDVMKALFSHILPFLKQQYTTSFSEWLPQLAADFCLNADSQNFPKLLSYFIEAQTANRQALPQFLIKLLVSQKRIAVVEPAIIMHVWLKSLVLLTPHHVIVSQLTKQVVQLPTFSEMTNLTSEEILHAKEPLCVFVAAVGKTYNAASYQRRCEIADNFNAYLRNFDKWLVNGADNNVMQQSETAFRFYSFLAIVIYNCPHIVYTKSKMTCFFHVAITRFVLPTSIQMNKPPESKLTQLVHKIWPVLVQGVGRLNFKTDAYIQKTLNDLIQRWTPHFKTVSTNPKVVARPFITCLLGDNPELSLYICERLTTLFLVTQRRQADPQACLVVSIFQEIITAITLDVDSTSPEPVAVQRIKTFMKGTSLMTLEHIMMVDDVVPSRTLLLELFRRLLTNTLFRNSTELQEMFAEHLRILTKKHLAYYTFFFFDLFMKIAKISYESISNIMDFLFTEVRVVEQKRGAGEDNRIRDCLQKLQQCLESEKRKKVPRSNTS